MLLIGYCLGNLLAPQMWEAKYAPRYYVPWGVILASFVVCPVIFLAIGYFLKRENARRDRLDLVPEKYYDENGDLLDSTFLDLTDRQVGREGCAHAELGVSVSPVRCRCRLGVCLLGMHELYATRRDPACTVQTFHDSSPYKYYAQHHMPHQPEQTYTLTIGFPNSGQSNTRRREVD